MKTGEDRPHCVRALHGLHPLTVDGKEEELTFKTRYRLVKPHEEASGKLGVPLLKGLIPSVSGSQPLVPCETPTPSSQVPVEHVNFEKCVHPT